MEASKQIFFFEHSLKVKFEIPIWTCPKLIFRLENWEKLSKKVVVTIMLSLQKKSLTNCDGTEKKVLRCAYFSVSI